MENAPFNPSAPYASARELLKRWEERTSFLLWHAYMVDAYGEDETIKLFEVVLYEHYADGALDTRVIETVEEALKYVTAVKRNSRS